MWYGRKERKERTDRSIDFAFVQERSSLPEGVLLIAKRQTEINHL